ncbi:hypothetical protein [Rhizobium vallis]|uniref:hypothetical protein n=1 Tax=Rhizobium vallis TaxID=634290 RepID=UPI0013E01781|nr:hypothetical protein [Rhizobium vallis]
MTSAAATIRLATVDRRVADFAAIRALLNNKPPHPIYIAMDWPWPEQTPWSETPLPPAESQSLDPQLLCVSKSINIMAHLAFPLLL